MLKVVLVCAVFVLSSADGFALKAKLPAYIERCSLSDPNINECFVKNGNRIIPRLVRGDPLHNIPDMNPYKLKEVVLCNNNQLRFVLKNVRIHGLEKARLTGVKLNFDQGTLAQNLTIPRLSILGDYELNGKIIDEFVQGNGKANISIVNGLYTSKLKFANKNNHAVPINSYTYYKPQLVVYDLENLYNGNEFRGYQTNVYFNNNWREVHKILKPEAARNFNNFIYQIYTIIGNTAPVSGLYLE